jgi:hypothetical protein
MYWTVTLVLVVQTVVRLWSPSFGAEAYVVAFHGPDSTQAVDAIAPENVTVPKSAKGVVELSSPQSSMAQLTPLQISSVELSDWPTFSHVEWFSTTTFPDVPSAMIVRLTLSPTWMLMLEK